MKKLYVKICILLSLVIIACEEPKPDFKGKDCTLFFIDKSDEHNYSEMVQMKVNRILNRDINNRFNRVHDKGEIFFIHNSTSLSGRYRNPIIAPEFPKGEDQHKERVLQLRKYNRLFKELVKKALVEPPRPENGSTKGSDIWSILYVANKVLYPHSEHGKNHIYIVSDMRENKKYSRNFHKYPPKSVEEARQFGQEDYERIVNKHPSLIRSDKLEGATVHIIFTADILANNDALVFEAYWTEIFKRFQMPVIIE